MNTTQLIEAAAHEIVANMVPASYQDRQYLELTKKILSELVTKATEAADQEEEKLLTALQDLECFIGVNCTPYVQAKCHKIFAPILHVFHDGNFHDPAYSDCATGEPAVQVLRRGPIQVGGRAQCPKCGEYYDMADIHQCETPSAAEKLLPCPFCGDEHITVSEYDTKDHWWIQCDNIYCGAEGPARLSSAEEAIKAWNKRHSGQAVDEKCNCENLGGKHSLSCPVNSVSTDRQEVSGWQAADRQGEWSLETIAKYLPSNVGIPAVFFTQLLEAINAALAAERQRAEQPERSANHNAETCTSLVLEMDQLSKSTATEREEQLWTALLSTLAAIEKTNAALKDLRARIAPSSCSKADHDAIRQIDEVIQAIKNIDLSLLHQHDAELTEKVRQPLVKAITGLASWLHSSLVCKQHVWEPDQRAAAQETLDDALAQERTDPTQSNEN